MAIMAEPPVNVLFVCLGNICRSPTAHGIFQHQVAVAGLHNKICIDSAGTGDWHIGRSPDRRAQLAASQRGYDLSNLRARQVTREDFDRFQYILAMDKDNLRDLQAMAPDNYSGTLALFLTFDSQGTLSEVPDPYYGGDDGFLQVLDMVESASTGLLEHIVADHLL